MEIGRARTPRTIISYNASHGTPPTNTSMERFVRQALHIRCTKEHELVLATKHCQQFRKFVNRHHKYLPYLSKSYKNKGCPNFGIDENTSVVRKQCIIIIIIIIIVIVRHALLIVLNVLIIIEEVVDK